MDRTRHRPMIVSSSSSQSGDDVQSSSAARLVLSAVAPVAAGEEPDRLTLGFLCRAFGHWWRVVLPIAAILSVVSSAVIWLC